MQDLPPYFKEYMEQKFNFSTELIEQRFIELHNTINSTFTSHDNEILDIKKEIHETKEDVKWLNQKVWMAMGALGVISMVGGIFVYYFKTLNKAQIEEVIRPLQAQTQKAQMSSESTDETLKKNYY